MKRKLINFEVFDKLNEGSLLATEQELVEAEDVLANILSKDGLRLHTFTESDVIYETLDKTYIHAGFQHQNNSLVFENIEELVIDEAAAKEKARTVLTQVVDNILENNKEKANKEFSGYLALPTVRRQFMEGEQVWVKKKNDPVDHRGKQPAWVVQKRTEAKKKSQAKKSSYSKSQDARKRKAVRSQFGGDVQVHLRNKPQAAVKTVKPKKMREWLNLSENVFGYLDFHEFGPILRESEIKQDDRSNVVSVRIPTSHARNENKILTFNWKTLNTEVQVLRSKVKKVHEDTSFCHAMCDLRKANSVSDSGQIETILEAIVGRWPSLLCLTQVELAEQIAAALESAGEDQHDEDVCNFFAEGILRKAMEAYQDRVTRIVRLSGNTPLDKTKDDVYESFQKIVDGFYAQLDESQAIEMQVFVDLYNTLVEIHKVAQTEGNEILKGETSEYLTELKAVIEQEAQPTLELAGEVAGWLHDLVETNLEGHSWDVNNKPHSTVNGDHPQMAKNAQKGYTPSGDFSGNWGDEAPVSDGKSYRGGLADEMRHRSWGNIGGEDTYPSLKNPYVPKPYGDYKMKEKSAVDDGQSDWSRWQSKDTWPNLQNPNTHPSPWDKGKYKMKSDNLVVDQ